MKVEVDGREFDTDHVTIVFNEGHELDIYDDTAVIYRPGKFESEDLQTKELIDRIFND